MSGSTLSAGSMKSTRSIKTSERVARELVNHIVDNDLAEGTKLPNEKQLVEVFEVGRTTLREALRLLETRGVITIRPGPGGGPIVRRPRGDDLREGLTLFLQFSGGALKDVLDARTALEPMLARLAADRITDEQVDELGASVQRMRDSSQDQGIFLSENQFFRGKIAEYAGSGVLRAFSDTLTSIADGLVVGVEHTARRRLAVAAALEKVVDALCARDGDAAAEAMRTHIGEAGDFWNRKHPELNARPIRWVH